MPVTLPDQRSRRRTFVAREGTLVRVHRQSPQGRFTMRATLLLVLLTPLSVAAQTASRHPDRRFVDESVPVTNTLRLGGPRTPLGVSLAEAALATIGREDGPDHFIFGDIANVGTTKKGAIIVVDRKNMDVRLFDDRGQFLQRLGRAGQGPGEFRAPHSLLVTPTDDIWIADMQRRLTVFGPSPDGYRLVRTIPVEIGIRSMCILRGELVANGIALGDPFVIRVLDSLARPVRAFGKLYASPNAVLNVQFAEGGRIACDAANDIIVYASQAALGEVRAYRRDGRAVWRTVIEDVRTNIITETDGGGVRVERSPDGAHSLLSLNVLPGVGIVLQYDLRTAPQMAAREQGETLTILLDARTGAATLASGSWPRLGALSPNRALVVHEDPAPRIESRELRQRR